MSVAEFDRLAEAVSRHCKYIYLHVKGEPLIHPQLAEILESCEHHGLHVNLTTNGVLLPEKAPLLFESPAMRQTNLSLHGYTPSTHGEMETWLGSLCDYARGMSVNGRYTVFRFWTLDKSRQPEEQDSRMLELLERQFPEKGSLEAYSGTRSVELAKGIFISFEEQFVWPSMDNPDYGGTGSCYGGRAMIGILADGTVVPCCLDGEGVCNLGNAFETPLDEILLSQRYRKLSGGFANHRVIEPLCRSCGYRLRFL